MAIINGTENNDSLTGGTENDTINGLPGDDTLDGGAGNDTLDGGWGVDVLFGGTGADRIIGNTSGYVVDDGLGGTYDAYTNDTLIGGPADDVYVLNDFHLAQQLSGDVIVDIIEEADGGTDTIITSDAFAWLRPNMEHLVRLAGGHASGNDLSNRITGSNGHDTLRGGEAGNDTLVGNAGNDRLEGRDWTTTAWMAERATTPSKVAHWRGYPGRRHRR